MERETVKIDADVAQRAREQVKKINQRLARKKGASKPSKVTLGEFLSKAIDHYIELGYDPSRDEDKNPLKETVVRTTDRIITYLQSHEKWYMEPVKLHLQRVDARLEQQDTFGPSGSAESTADLQFIKEMSLFSYLTSDLVLNLLFHQYRDNPDALAEIQEWAGQRYKARYDELMEKYEQG